MTDARTRDALRQALEPSLGAEPTALLLEQLPTVLDRIDERFEHIDERFQSQEALWSERLARLESSLLAAFRHELNQAIVSQTRTMIFSTFGAIVSLGGVAFGVAAIG